MSPAGLTGPDSWGQSSCFLFPCPIRHWLRVKFRAGEWKGRGCFGLPNCHQGNEQPHG